MSVAAAGTGRPEPGAATAAAGQPEQPAVLRVTRATKSYPGGVTALDDVSLTVRAGELLAIVGPSGSGKSTLLNIMGTLDLPTHGSVEIGGRTRRRSPTGGFPRCVGAGSASSSSSSI